MTLQWYTSNFADNDMVDTNIKDGVDIFGVEWTFKGEFIPSTSVPMYIIGSWIYWAPWAEEFWYLSFSWEYNGKINTIWGVGFDSWILQLDSPTWTITRTYGYWFENWLVSVYKNGNSIFCNYNDYGNHPKHYEYNFITTTRWTSQVGYYTTGTSLTSYITYNWYKYIWWIVQCDTYYYPLFKIYS